MAHGKILNAALYPLSQSSQNENLTVVVTYDCSMNDKKQDADNTQSYTLYETQAGIPQGTNPQKLAGSKGSSLRDFGFGAFLCLFCFVFVVGLGLFFPHSTDRNYEIVGLLFICWFLLQKKPSQLSTIPTDPKGNSPACNTTIQLSTSVTISMLWTEVFSYCKQLHRHRPTQIQEEQATGEFFYYMAVHADVQTVHTHNKNDHVHVYGINNRCIMSDPTNEIFYMHTSCAVSNSPFPFFPFPPPPPSLPLCLLIQTKAETSQGQITPFFHLFHLGFVHPLQDVPSIVFCLLLFCSRWFPPSLLWRRMV